MFICNFIEDPALSAIRNKYNIPLEIAENLLKLRKFEIVIVCDDSGSMETLVDGTQRTRWDELRSIVKIVLDISVSFALNGVDIHFLNGRNLFKVKDPGIIDQAFAKSPCGYTPLVPVLKKIFTSDLARRGRDKKLLVFVATDGQPTDDNGNPQVDELKHLMQETRQSVTTHVTFLLCTDDQDSVGYLDKWDKEMKNVDVTDDYNTETKKIRQYRGDNYPFSYGDYVVKALAGAIIQAIDIINEPD
jgi:hypothetical protein